MVEAKNDRSITLYSLVTQEDVRPQVPGQGGDKVWAELAAVVGPDTSGGASSSSSSNAVGLDVLNATNIDMNEFPVLETPYFNEGRVGTPNIVNLNCILLPLGEALSSFASNLYFMRENLQPFMGFAVGVDAEVADRLRFRDAGTQIGISQ